MGIGYRIKEARERQGLTQIELGKLVGVTGSSITNYENETSHPKEVVMYKLINALKVDANYLFQDCVNLPKETNDVTLAEYDHINKYRVLDHHGKKMVDFTLNEEWERSRKLASRDSKVVLLNSNKGESSCVEESATMAHLLPDAAHDSTNVEITEEMLQHDENIMNDENF